MTPTIETVTVTPGRTTRSVTVICPFCGRRHTHGWPYTEPTIGQRLAHCGRGDYSITAKEVKNP